MLLKKKGHFQLFANFIRSYSLDNQDPETILRLKATLWAVGNIGATRNGLPFLEEEDIVKDIVNMAEESNILSLKGYVNLFIFDRKKFLILTPVIIAPVIMC